MHINFIISFQCFYIFKKVLSCLNNWWKMSFVHFWRPDENIQLSLCSPYSYCWYVRALIYPTWFLYLKNISYGRSTKRIPILFHLSHCWRPAIGEYLQSIFTSYWLLLKSPTVKGPTLDKNSWRQKSLQLLALCSKREKALLFGDTWSKSMITFWGGGGCIKRWRGVLTRSGFWRITRISCLRLGQANTKGKIQPLWSKESVVGKTYHSFICN